MQRSRVLEIARPISVAPVTAGNSSSPGATYRFTLPHEVAGFCTLIMPRGAPRGMTATLRHGEAVDMGTGLLVDVECTYSLGPDHGLHCVHMSYVASGDASGMSAHEQSWRQLALHGNASSAADDIDGELEAFTPAFQFSAFRFIEVTYSHTTSPLKVPDTSSMACYRVGAGFDWTGDVIVAAPPAASSGKATHGGTPTTAAHRFNTVVAATRSTAISNYLMDVPTDCPHREKRGWTGDSLAAHRAVASFFDMRAAWTKWVDDILFMQSMLEPAGMVPTIVPCIFSPICRNDPRHSGNKPRATFADVAWGSVLPLLGSYTAKLTGDDRLASRAAVGAGTYVSLLHQHSNNAWTSDFPGLLNYTNWSGHLGDWCPAVGQASVSTLLNSHHVILDTDAALALRQQTGQLSGSGNSAHGTRMSHHPPHTTHTHTHPYMMPYMACSVGEMLFATAAAVLTRCPLHCPLSVLLYYTVPGVAVGPSEADLQQWAKTARESFAKAFLRNITVPGTAPPPPPRGPLMCGRVKEKVPLVLSCSTGQTIMQVTFAGYGLPNGTCATGLEENANCYLNVSSQVSARCLGQSECSVECDVIPHARICAGVNVSDPCGGVAKHLSVSMKCSATSKPALLATPVSGGPITGLAFRDLYPPVPTQGVQPQTEAASGMAAMDSAPASLISEKQRVALSDMLAALVVNHNSSSTSKVSITGGIIDMAHLAPVLIGHGRPDVAFNLLAADAYPSYYNMAKYGGTLWERWDNANGCDTPAGCDNKVQCGVDPLAPLCHYAHLPHTVPIYTCFHRAIFLWAAGRPNCWSCCVAVLTALCWPLVLLYH